MDTKKIADVLLKRFSVTPGRAEEIASEIALLFARTEEIVMSPRPHVWGKGEVGVVKFYGEAELKAFLETHSHLGVTTIQDDYAKFCYSVTYLTEKGVE